MSNLDSMRTSLWALEQYPRAYDACQQVLSGAPEELIDLGKGCVYWRQTVELGRMGCWRISVCRDLSTSAKEGLPKRPITRALVSRLESDGQPQYGYWLSPDAIFCGSSLPEPPETADIFIGLCGLLAARRDIEWEV